MPLLRRVWRWTSGCFAVLRLFESQRGWAQHFGFVNYALPLCDVVVRRGEHKFVSSAVYVFVPPCLNLGVCLIGLNGGLDVRVESTSCGASRDGV